MELIHNKIKKGAGTALFFIPLLLFSEYLLKYKYKLINGYLL